MNIYSALILTTVTPSLADSHTLRLRVYCVPAACAPALAATFPDAFAPHPGPKTSGHPAWPGATPGMTPARPHHTSTHTHKYWWTQSQSKKQPPFTDSHIQSHQGSGNPPLSTWAQTHICKDISTTFTTGKEEEKGKTEIVGLPQEHYSNASQRLPTKERERQRKKQMRSKEKWKQFRPFMYSILIWHATRAVLRMLEYEAANSQKHKQLNAIVIFSDADESLRCRWSFPVSF